MMPSTASHDSATAARSLVLLSLLAFGSVADAVPSNGESRSHYVVKRALTYNGCYSSSQPLSNQGSYTYQSPSYCDGICGKSGSAVLALSDGKNCWCGNQLPAASTKVDDSNCNVGCDGYGSIMCGGSGYFTVYLTGAGQNVQNYGGGSSDPPSSSGSSSPSSSSSSSSSDSTPSTTTTSPPTVITSITPGRTVVVTQPAAVVVSPTASVTKSKGGSSNVAGIAAGVVVGVVGLGSIIGVGAYFFLRQRKRRQAEEEYRQRSQADFMRGIERKGSNSYSNMSDSRMDPEAGRRNSVGSLADNQDYSRRILRVANPDSS